MNFSAIDALGDFERALKEAKKEAKAQEKYLKTLQCANGKSNYELFVPFLEKLKKNGCLKWNGSPITKAIYMEKGGRFTMLEDCYKTQESPYNGLDKTLTEMVSELFALYDVFVAVVLECGLLLSVDKAFNVFLKKLGHWWLALFLGYPTTVGLAFEFFARFYIAMNNHVLKALADDAS